MIRLPIGLPAILLLHILLGAGTTPASGPSVIFVIAEPPPTSALLVHATPHPDGDIPTSPSHKHGLAQKTPAIAIPAPDFDPAKARHLGDA